jgi:hypothetical protein
VQGASTSWDIFEIKTPHTKLLVDLPRRSKFYSAFEGYVSQCREYIEVLDDPRTRDEFKAREGISINKRPSVTMVAGRSIGLDRTKLHALASSRLPSLTLLTFDDLRAQLECYRLSHYGRYERAKGYGLALIVSLLPTPLPFVRNHLLDIGSNPTADRISVFIDSDNSLALVAIDSDGVEHIAKARLPLEPADFAEPHLMLLGVGVGEDFGVLSIELDGRHVAELRTQAFPFAVAPYHVIGSDMTGIASSWFQMHGYIVLNGLANLAQRTTLRDWVRRHAYGMPAVVFPGRQSLRTESHPFLGVPTDAPASVGASQRSERPAQSCASVL